LKLNRVEIEECTDSKSAGGAARPKKKKKQYDLNANDRFWTTQKGK
jgi:hypothetical protein